MDWFDLSEVQGTLKSLLQHHKSKASLLWHSAFFQAEQPKVDKAGRNTERRHFGPHHVVRAGEVGVVAEDSEALVHLATYISSNFSQEWAWSHTQTSASLSPWLISPALTFFPLQLSSLQNISPPASQWFWEESEAGGEGVMGGRANALELFPSSRHLYSIILVSFRFYPPSHWDLSLHFRVFLLKRLEGICVLRYWNYLHSSKTFIFKSDPVICGLHTKWRSGLKFNPFCRHFS